MYKMNRRAFYFMNYPKREIKPIVIEGYSPHMHFTHPDTPFKDKFVTYGLKILIVVFGGTTKIINIINSIQIIKPKMLSEEDRDKIVKSRYKDSEVLHEP